MGGSTEKDLQRRWLWVGKERSMGGQEWRKSFSIRAEDFSEEDRGFHQVGDSTAFNFKNTSC